MTLKNDMAVLVLSFDGYSSLWKPFFELKEKNWPDCKYKTYLVTEEKDPKFKGVEVIRAGKNKAWSERVRIALDYMKEQYLCLFLDDFFIGTPVDQTKIESLYEQMIKYDLAYMKCPYTETGKTRKIKKERKRFKDTSNLFCTQKNKRYGISVMSGIWKRDYFRKLIGEEDYNPWKFETDRIKEAKNQTSEPFPDVVVEYSNPFGIWNGVIQGKYVPSTFQHIKKQGVELSLEDIKLMDKSALWRLRTKRFFMHVTPLRLYPVVKKIGRLFGFRFVSDETT